MLLLTVLNATTFGQDEATRAPGPQAADVIGHLDQTIQWYQAVDSAAQQPDLTTDASSRGRAHQSAVSALQLAFDFARAEATLVPGQQPAPAAPPTAGSASNLTQLEAHLTDRVNTLQTKLAGLDERLAHATAKDRASLLPQRDALRANVQLAKTIQADVEQILRFAATAQASGTATSSLTARINELERSIPEARHTISQATSTAPGPGARPAAAASTSTVASPMFRPQSAGIVALAAQLVALTNTRRSVTGVLRVTDALMQSVADRRAPLVAEMRTAVQRADAAETSQTGGASASELQADVARVKQVSAALVPLAEQGLAVEDTRAILAGWHTGLAARAGRTGRYLLIRLVAVLLAIAVVLALSEAWRRGTLRYLDDVRKRREFDLFRHILVAAAIVVVLLVSFVSQIGSLATYAGFVTAGVAVALQNVILAVVAYFLLIGRYGIRVGDRLTIGGVTGSVVDMGLVRLYMMELAQPDWHPTGRIVVYSNAVIFQPSALFKQMPGVDYLWHRITLTIAPTADLARAEHTIRTAVEAAYTPFKAAIDQQYATLQENVDLQTPAPGPDVQIRFGEEGAALLVRYPVVRARDNEMDNRMITAVRDAVAAAPGIPLTQAGAPKIAADG
ncbi:MAG TPA: mechanosensitive ion channel family protein [Vicinamibacterales bacterium]|nr:mechanosensitive ion channel family protein [Vicinamibacterales bacterium]